MLDKRLQNDCLIIAQSSMNYLLLNKDANYPWVILVPKQENISELFELSEQDQWQLNLEVNLVAARLKKAFQADKMNIAAIGNVVNQLHVHIIARFKLDSVWPKPVWGAIEAKPYAEKQLKNTVELILHAIDDLDFSRE
ncbi:HIT domain-containing protein [Marinicellulosiphila megalodicopiae]|uniref:HIT domain-containing protein n=1 Tax=Marinicellulosiphila megalodicopiae TaxID=2724896 RepID=UPI003BB16BF7